MFSGCQIITAKALESALFDVLYTVVRQLTFELLDEGGSLHDVEWSCQPVWDDVLEEPMFYELRVYSC